MTLTRAAWLVVAVQVAALVVMAAVVGAQNVVTLLNTRYNAESTGNVLTIPVQVDIQAAVCNSVGTGWSNWDGITGGTDTPTFACVAGLSNGPVGVLDYDDSATEYAWNRFILPSDWTSTIDLALYWSTTATSGNAVWQIQTACVADNEAVDAAWNTAQTITDAAKGTTTRLNSASLTSLTTTGCAAGEIFKFRIGRDPAHASDTIAATARLYNVIFTYRRAI